MLRIVDFEEIQDLLNHVHALVNRLEQNDPEFVPEVKRWLHNLEKVLKRCRMPVVSTVASLRGVLISTEQGFIPAWIKYSGRPTRRKIRNAVAVDILRRVDAVLSNDIQQYGARIAEAEIISREMATRAYAKGLLGSGSFNSDLAANQQAAWDAISTDPDIAPYALKLLNFVGPQDALTVVNRAVTAYGLDQVKDREAA